MDAGEFERDLGLWIDGELPAERAARMQSAVDASPELARRAEFERRFHARVTNAMASDADAAVVAAMIARAQEAPAGRMRRIRRAAWRAAAAVLVVAVTGMWWFCVPPFECPYLQALDAALHDAAAAPHALADSVVTSSPLPERLDGAVAASPAAVTTIHVHGERLLGARLDYVAADGATTLHVVACVSPAELHPSIRRRVEKDGEVWWTRVHGGERTWVFQSSATGRVYAVSGGASDEATVWNAAKALRKCVK